ncbi:MAG TPA: shikimate kinase [Euzebyales bacterium]|nr:shikimate kinase [Euzebyales bacterium]
MTGGVVTLIGLMGAGKTRVGRTAAAAVGRAFVDTDRLVERTAGRTITDIFASEGELGFRRRERAAVEAATATPGALVSVGGGAVLDERNVARMRAAGQVVWLYAEPETLAQRLRRSVLRGDRPLLVDADPVAVLRGLLEERRAAYDAAATTVLCTDGLAVEESTRLLTDWLREHA